MTQDGDRSPKDQPCDERIGLGLGDSPTLREERGLKVEFKSMISDSINQAYLLGTSTSTQINTYAARLSLQNASVPFATSFPQVLFLCFSLSGKLQEPFICLCFLSLP